MIKSYRLWRFSMTYNKHRQGLTDGCWYLGVRCNSIFISILLGYLSLTIDISSSFGS